MTPVEIGKGRGFKGLASYLLHHEDRGETAALSDRVGWTQSFNLNDADPERAWRLMTATAMSAEALKEAAGIRKGKPTEKAVYHYSLNFNPKDGATPALQRKAALSSLQALGLQDYQALAVMHRDKDHDHVHVMVNLISPEDGISAASKHPDGSPAKLSMSKTKLSKWAMAFEREHGLTITEGRIANQTARANGEAPKNTKRLARPVYEARKQEGSEARTAWMSCQEDDKRLAIARDQRESRERQQTEWAVLKEAYRQEKDARAKAQPTFKAIAAGIKAEMKPAWAELFRRQRQELRQFEQAEKGLGWFWNAVTTLFEVGKEQGAGAALAAALSPDARQDTVMKRHRYEAGKLRQIAQDHIEAAITAQKRYSAETADAARKDYLARCAALKQTHERQNEAMRGRWCDYKDDRRERMQKARTPVRAQERGRPQGWGRRQGLEPQ